MAGKSIRDLKLRRFPAIAAIVVASITLISGWFFLGRFLTPETRLASETLADSPQKFAEPSSSVSVESPAPEPTVAQNSSINEQEKPAPKEVRQGMLRIANPSEHPVRVALLLKKSGQPKEVGSKSESYEPPAHWDFAPGEGRTKGLLLSLPNRSVKVKQGDVLVAFAQDGSRHYWGPYVVGETAVPNWVASSSEWQLVLEP